MKKSEICYIHLMAKNFTEVLYPSSLVPQLFEPEVLGFLTRHENQPILHWLDDSANLVANTKVMAGGISNGSQFYDYSFMLTPAFKALEQWILNIAPSLGVSEKKIRDAQDFGKFGAFLNDDAMSEVVKDVVAKLELDSEKEKSLRQSLHALETYLKNLRHHPAHCGGKVDSAVKAETMYREIVGAIDRLTLHLLTDKILT